MDEVDIQKAKVLLGDTAKDDGRPIKGYLCRSPISYGDMAG